MTDTMRSAPWRKTDQRRATRRPTIADDVLVTEFKKNRGAETVRVMLRSYENSNLVDVRTWLNTSDGRCVPGKGFTCDVRRLPELAKALAKAESKARELGVLRDG